MSRGSDAGEKLADQPLDVTVSAPTLLCKGFRRYERFEVAMPVDHGPATDTVDVLHVGRVVAVLPIDPARNEIVMIRQFRLPAHLANGRGRLVEIVAGHVEQGEDLIEAAHRECIEEIGVAPSGLVELFSFIPTPGLSDEEITLFLGIVDSSQLPARAGAAHENEATHPFAVPIDQALDALAAREMRNGPLILALQWLALNRARLDEIVRGRAAAS
jgi:ADP-ribose pyrophosphatase